MPKYKVYLQSGETIVVEAKRMEGTKGIVQFWGDVPGQGEGIVAFFLDTSLIGVVMEPESNDDLE